MISNWGGCNALARFNRVCVRLGALVDRGLPVRNILIFLLCFVFACIITAVEAVGLDWGD